MDEERVHLTKSEISDLILTIWDAVVALDEREEDLVADELRRWAVYLIDRSLGEGGPTP
jgi:hypothetical protein